MGSTSQTSGKPSHLFLCSNSASFALTSSSHSVGWTTSSCTLPKLLTMASSTCGASSNSRSMRLPIWTPRAWIWPSLTSERFWTTIVPRQLHGLAVALWVAQVSQAECPMCSLPHLLRVALHAAHHLIVQLRAWLRLHWAILKTLLQVPCSSLQGAQRKLWWHLILQAHVHEASAPTTHWQGLQSACPSAVDALTALVSVYILTSSWPKSSWNSSSMNIEVLPSLQCGCSSTQGLLCLSSSSAVFCALKDKRVPSLTLTFS